jgi:hypothetical protein
MREDNTLLIVLTFSTCMKKLFVFIELLVFLVLGRQICAWFSLGRRRQALFLTAPQYRFPLRVLSRASKPARSDFGFQLGSSSRLFLDPDPVVPVLLTAVRSGFRVQGFIAVFICC